MLCPTCGGSGNLMVSSRPMKFENMLHLAVRLGWFKSVSEALRAGWNAPAKGSHTVGKRTIVAE